MSEKKIRLGFVGVGGMGQCAHLKNYTLLPECEVVALAELRQDVAHKVAARYAVPRVYQDAGEMLAKEKLDGLVCTQPFTRHGQILPGLLEHGLPLFTEKPIAGSIEVGEKIVAAAKRNKTWHMVGYHKRSDPATMYAKEQIGQLKQSQELGKLKYVRLLMPAGDFIAGGFNDLIQGNGPDQPLTWDQAASDMDKSTNEFYISFVNYYIHQVNLLRHLLGEPYQVAYADPAGVVLAARSASGVPGIIEMSPYCTTIDWQESALVAFERGWIKLELPAPLAFNRPGRVEIFKDAGGGKMPQTIVPQLPWVHAMRQQAINFCRAIRGEAQAPCDSAEALEDIKIAREYIRLWKGK